MSDTTIDVPVKTPLKPRRNMTELTEKHAALLMLTENGMKNKENWKSCAGWY